MRLKRRPLGEEVQIRRDMKRFKGLDRPLRERIARRYLNLLRRRRRFRPTLDTIVEIKFQTGIPQTTKSGLNPQSPVRCSARE